MSFVSNPKDIIPIKPGWYPTEQPLINRWWNGRQWTETYSEPANNKEETHE